MDFSLLSLDLFDWLLVAVLAYSIISAFLRGLVLELFSLGGLVAGILIASWNYQHLARLLGSFAKHIVTLSPSTCNIIAFLTIVVLVMLLAGLVGNLVRRAAHVIGLGFFDRLLGAVFGLFRGYLLGAAILMAAVAFLPKSTQIANSRLSTYFLAEVHAVSFVVPQGLRQMLLNGVAELKHNAPGWIKPH